MCNHMVAYCELDQLGFEQGFDGHEGVEDGAGDGASTWTTARALTGFAPRVRGRGRSWRC